MAPPPPAALAGGGAGATSSRAQCETAKVESEPSPREVQLVAESVLQTREEMGRKFAAVDEKIERTASETQSMITFSHQALDRRVSALEESH